MQEKIVKAKSLRVFQISDTHLYAEKSKKLKEVETYQSCQNVLDDIATRFQPNQHDILLVTGDLVHDYSTQAYQHLKNLVSKYKWQIYYIPGNHDDSKQLSAALLEMPSMPFIQTISTENWDLILINSQLDDRTDTEFNSEQLSEVKAVLERTKHNILLALHHNLFNIGSERCDPYKVKNAEDFIALLEQFAQVKIVLSGHVHHVNEQVINNIAYLTAPSTCYQIVLDEQNLQSGFPGYRYLELNEENFLSKVFRVIP